MQAGVLGGTLGTERSHSESRSFVSRVALVVGEPANSLERMFHYSGEASQQIPVKAPTGRLDRSSCTLTVGSCVGVLKGRSCFMARSVSPRDCLTSP